MARQVDLKTTEFQSSDVGKIITDNRKFGVELEVIAKNEGAVVSLDEVLSKTFGFHHDGSVRGKRGEIGIEIVTPILSGKKGEETVTDLLNKMNKIGFDTNFSCGLHVHHDASDMLPSKGCVTQKASTYDFNNWGGDYKVIVQEKLYKILKKLGYSDEDISNIGKISKGAIITFDDKSTARGRKIEFGDGKKLIFYQYGNLNFVCSKSVFQQLLHTDNINLVFNPKDYLSIYKRHGNTEAIKDIMMFYTVFTDVFLAMLPEDRRNNGAFSSTGRDFCQKLNERISPFDIMRCQNLEQLEKLWLKADRPNEIAHKKGNQYDESRYYGVNFHALFAKYGTIEIRWHEGTTDPTQVLYWIAIHQHILKRIMEGNLNVRVSEGALSKIKLEDRVEYFFKVTKFPKYLENYLRHRLEFFTLKQN